MKDFIFIFIMINKSKQEFGMNKLIKTVDDVIKFANDIIQKVEDKFTEDEVIVLNTNKMPTIDIFTQNSCVAGSKAVTLLTEELRTAQKIAFENAVTGCGPHLKLVEHFKSTDTDIFFLNSEKEDRVQYGNIDIIHLKAKTIDTLLLNFDLPNCRAAYIHYEDKIVYYVSLHCLYSMLTGCYFLPTYFRDRSEFFRLYEANIKNKCIDYEHVENKLFNRLRSRIEKYEERGYTCRYVKTNHIEPWMINGFLYGEFTKAAI